MKIINIILLSTFALFLFTCKKKSDTPTQDELGYSYFPISVGAYSIYNVIDSSFQGNGISVVKRYQVKEEIHDPITVYDQTRYQVYLYFTQQMGQAFNSYPDSNWTEFNSGGRITRIENNISYIKLIFPFVVGATWDGNISDSVNNPQNYYTMTNVRRSFTYDSSSSGVSGGSLYYPQTVSVVQYNNSSALGVNYSVEVYADNVGMVYKEIKIYQYDQSQLSNQVVQYGRHYYKKLIATGRYE
jgi:hypothetical protein